MFISQDEDEEAEREELAAGDWISVSVEIERWNLLVCQLSDLQALTGFISRLTAANHTTNNQAADTRDTPELSVIGKRCILKVLNLNPLIHTQIRFESEGLSLTLQSNPSSNFVKMSFRDLALRHRKVNLPYQIELDN